MARFLLDHREVVRGGGFMDPLYRQSWHREHIGTDYVAVFVDIYAPIGGTITKEVYGKEGGNWLEFTLDDGYKFRLAHLNKYDRSLGRFNEGDLLGQTGNSGEETTGAHLHCQCNKPNGILIDPEEYFTNLLKSNYMAIIDNAVQYNKKFLSDIQNGVVAYGYDVGRGKPFKIANSKKEYFNSINDIIIHDLCLGMTSENADKIPNK